MLEKMLKKIMLGALPLTLAACGGGTDSASSTANQTPIAVSGLDQNALTGQTITLDGSSSYDPDQDEISYFWSFNTLPESSQSTLSDQTSVNPTFVPDVAGSYVLNLSVYDGKNYSIADEVTITVETANAVPVANAGSDQEVFTQSLVTLDASLSSDADGDVITYLWALTTKPSGSTASLSDTNAAKPTFTPDLDGQYAINLTVNDGQNSSTADEVLITATTQNVAPIANAGNDRDVNTFEVVTLNGSNSTDANGDSLSYTWAFVSRPDGSSATLQNANSQTSSFTPDLDGDYTLSLTVNDGQVASTPDNVVITATTANARPLADSGDDQVQFDLSAITLDGSSSSDADSDVLTYQWSIQSAPAGSSAVLANENTSTATLTPDVYGDYVFSLVVNDGTEDSLSDNVTVEVILPAQKSTYLSNNLTAFIMSSSSSSFNDYVQSGSQYLMNVRNSNSQTVDWLKFEVRDSNNVLFVSSTNASTLSDGSLTAGESANLQITLANSQLKPFTATFYWSDPLASDETFETTYVFADN